MHLGWVGRCARFFDGDRNVAAPWAPRPPPAPPPPADGSESHPYRAGRAAGVLSSPQLSSCAQVRGVYLCTPRHDRLPSHPHRPARPRTRRLRRHATEQGARRVLREKRPPDPRGELLQVPLAGEGQGERRTHARHARGLGKGRREWEADRARRAGEEPAHHRDQLSRRRSADAAEGREAHRRADRHAHRVGEDGRARPA